MGLPVFDALGLPGGVDGEEGDGQHDRDDDGDGGDYAPPVAGQPEFDGFAEDLRVRAAGLRLPGDS